MSRPEHTLRRRLRFRQGASCAWRFVRFTFLCACVLLTLAACTFPGSAAPVLKLGVIAPFEGRGRALGYAVLPAIKAAAAEVNASGELGRYRVLVVAFNDNLDPATARAQAAALALDPDVIGVVGPFSAETAEAATGVLTTRGIPLAPILGAQVTGDDFKDAQRQAKAAARDLLQALAAQIRATGGYAGPEALPR